MPSVFASVNCWTKASWSTKLSSSTRHKHEYRIVQSGKTWDLSKIDFEKLKEDFQRATYKNIEIADLRAFIQHKLDQMLKQNATRTDFAPAITRDYRRLQRRQFIGGQLL